MLVALGLAVTGCGGDDDPKGGSGGSGGTSGSAGAAGMAGSAGASGAGGSAGDPGYTLTASVEILRDTNGVPHIYAENDADLFYAYGYQLAVDRLWQLDMFRLTTQGRRAEVLGGLYPGTIGTTVLEDDQLVRMFNIPHWGAEDLKVMKQTDADRVALVEAWRAGINRRIREVVEGTVPRPFGFAEHDWLPEPWTEVDPWAIMWLGHLVQDQTLLYKILVTIVETFPTSPLDHIQLFKPARRAYGVPPEDRPAGAPGATSALRRSGPGPDAPWGGMTREIPPELLGSHDWFRGLANWSIQGSNNWVVDGRHTDNGKPLLAGDPHLGFNQSGFTYAVHLNSKDKGGTFDTAGFAFVSAPGILGGINDKIAWSPTSTFGDVMDLVGVEIVDGKANIGGQMVDLVEREETILVRDGMEKTVTIQEVPGYGVIFPPAFAGVPIPIAGPGREALILYTGFRGRTSRWFLELNRAQNLDEFDDGMLRVPEMSYSPVAADANGITLRVGLEVPARNAIVAGREPWAIMDGNDPDVFWPAGSLTPDQLPHSRGGTRGWLATANNDPFGFTEDGDPSNDPFYYGAFFVPGWRAGRIEDELVRLTAAGSITLGQMQALQQDVHAGDADDLIPLLEAAFAKIGTDPDLAEFAGDPDLQTLHDVITSWDRKMERESAGALAFHVFAHLTVVNLIEDDITGLVLDRIFKVAPFYMIKVATLALRGEYPDATPVMQKPGMATETGSADWHLLRGLKDTAAWLTTKFGSVAATAYTWSDMKVSDFNDGYGMGVALEQVPTRGGEATVNVSQSNFRNAGKVADKFVSNWGSIHRMVARFDDGGRPELWYHQPYGNVADKASKHFANMKDAYVEGDYVKMPFTRADVDAATDGTSTLEP